MKFNWLFLGLVLLFFATLGFAINGDRFRGALLPAAAFERAKGKITQSRLNAYQRRKRGMAWGKETVYSADIRFQFRVGGQIYTSELVDFDVSSSQIDPKSAQLRLRKYPLHRKIAVFYDPQNPHLAVLEPQNKARSLRALCFTAFLWVSGFLLVVTTSIKQWQKRRQISTV